MLRTLPSLRALGVLAAFSAALLILAGCAPAGEQQPRPTESSSAAATAAPAPAPTLVPEGSAEENLPLFRAVADSVWSTDQRAEGRAYIDGLVAAGFDRAAMQVTPDQTTVGNPVESLLFSVRWGEESCLVGQVGPSTGEVVTTVMPQLAGGRCLVGQTRPIDW